MFKNSGKLPKKSQNISVKFRNSTEKITKLKICKILRLIFMFS